MNTQSHQRHHITRSEDCSSSSDSAHSSYSSYQTRSTDPISYRSGKSLQRVPNHEEEEEDMTFYRTCSLDCELPSASTDTYSSVFSDSASLEHVDDGDYDDVPAPTEEAIPAVLPPYQASIIDPLVRPSTPEAFGRLFPSLDRLSIRHDDLTPDGNMNLRVDTVVPCTGRRPITVQLFHLRMHDLARREFSFRRYCRDSGREVCNSKRAYGQPRSVSGPAIQRSVSNAIHSLKMPFRRSSIGSSSQKRPSTGSSAASSSWDTVSIRSMRMRTDSWSSDKPPPPASTLVPTNSIKLEFSNYARVDVTRHEGRNSIRYEFEWWGHIYAWKRVYDKNLGTTSFHLVRDGHGSPVAHITPDSRSPNQIETDKWAGGWIPPCHMWINDQNIVDAVTDVADVLVATGLIAMVDDCIKDLWQVKKKHHSIVHRAPSIDLHGASPRSLMQNIFNRRHSVQHPGSPLRPNSAIAAC